MHSTVLAMLEFFEVIYKMKVIHAGSLENSEPGNNNHMYFVPSLLSSLVEGDQHPALQYWSQIQPK